MARVLPENVDDGRGREDATIGPPSRKVNDLTTAAIMPREAFTLG
jgi:hypothetical protein